MIPGVIPADDLAAAQADIPALLAAGERRGFPFRAQSVNRVIVHEALIDLATELLGTDRLRLYQGLASVKHADGPPDDEQLLHADYGNHTLVVPRAEPGYQQLTLFVYLTDVAPETAATRVVSLRHTAGIPVERTYLHLEEYAPIYALEECASGPAGSVLAYRPDVYHRGVALQQPGGVRYHLGVSFKTPGTDWLGSQAWPSRAEDLEWHAFVRTASLRQLLVLGFPEPGNAYWTEQTLAGVAARYPSLDMTPFRQAMPG